MRMQCFVAFLLAQLVAAETAANTTLPPPEGHGWSGGWCLAGVAEAGWIRSASLNPTMASTLAMDVKGGHVALVTGSNSGGSMFAIRYMVLRTFAVTSKFSYPCYLLTEPYRTTCYFHSGFGSITSECETEAFTVVMTATFTVYSGLMALYGGPLGVASVFCAVYFPFLAGLPLRTRDLNFGMFTAKFSLFSTVYGIPSNWVAAISRASPKGAGQPQYNYGFDSFLARPATAYTVVGSLWTISAYGNVTVSWVGAISANTQTGFVMLPFALATKGWDEASDVSLAAPVLKVALFLIQFLAIRRLTYGMQIVTVKDGIAPAKECASGCPVMDGGFTDNAPLTPVVAASALIYPYRPTYFLSIGASSTMTTVKYLLGSGPMGFWTMAGINICPLGIVEYCTLLTSLRTIMVEHFPNLSRKAYDDLASVYQIYRPEVKLLTPYCGDPLSFDLFEGMCSAESVCDMWSTVVPSKINMVSFTPDIYVVVFVMAYLQATPVSNRFVTAYLPQAMWNLQYYARMDVWFPNYDAIAPQKGGMGFTKVAGNSILDFMTYLNIRLVGYLMGTKTSAAKLNAGIRLPCQYQQFKKTEKATYTEPAFLIKESR